MPFCLYNSNDDKRMEISRQWWRPSATPENPMTKMRKLVDTKVVTVLIEFLCSLGANATSSYSLDWGYTWWVNSCWLPLTMMIWPIHSLTPAAPWLPSSSLPGAAAWVKDMGFLCPCSQAGEGGGGLDDTYGADAYVFLLHASWSE